MLTIQRILFTTDLSEGARRAFPQAVHLADRHDAGLHVLNVTNPRRHDGSETTASFPVSLDTLADWFATSAREENCPDLATMSITQKQVESESPPERIIDYVGDEGIDLVVMGTHGRRGVNRMLFGSVTEEVLRRAPCPLLTVQTGADMPSAHTAQRILVPVDFSEASETALRHAAEIASTYGAELDLLHVVEEMVYPSNYGLEPSNFPAKDILGRVEKSLDDLVREDVGYEHASVGATVGHPPTAILDHMEENETDLVVIATQGRTGLERVLVGSVAERVIRQSPAPVFALKPDQKFLLPTPSADTGTTEE
ncbi:MAG: universal stress protein [Salinibacter sp.]|uniref:universal stress protein n=1 Tax=Salinibacter sp. TaxID=2065818 RepID=UPI0035D435BC